MANQALYLLTFDHLTVQPSAVDLTLISHKTDELADNPIINFVHKQKSQSDTTGFELVLFDERLAFYDKVQTLVLTADNTLDELTLLLDESAAHRLVFFVNDFKDGRIFSLIRYLRNQGFLGDIYLLGNYGLDQAAYYQKSGATGFFVQATQLDTLLKTLSDLKSGHLGQSAKTLPMFQ